MRSDEDIKTAGVAHAAFILAQIAFSALVRNGIIPMSEAERTLKQAIEASKSGDLGNQAAAHMLEIVLAKLSDFQPPTRQ